MPASNFVSQMSFKIDGKEPSEMLKGRVNEIVVDTSLYLPDMFSIQFDDHDRKCIDDKELAIGKTIEISAQPPNSGGYALLMKGEIIALEPDYIQDFMTFIIRGYDKSHRLHRGKKCKTFIKMSDSDIVEKIAGGCGVSVEVDKTGIIHEHVFQDNRTDMEFIHDRARRVGFYCYVENGKLFFKNPSTQGAAVELEWGKDLIDFQARLTSAGQVNSAEVHGWDVKTKAAIIGSKKTPTGTSTIAETNHGGNLAGSKLGLSEIKEIRHNRPVNTQSEADILAQSDLNEHCQAFFQADGRSRGNTAIRAGKTIKLKGLGERFSNDCMVTRAVHIYNISGYLTKFEINGYRSSNLKDILSGAQEDNVYGVVSGIVTDVKDPDGLSRVKVKYPAINDTLSSHWARFVSPMAGPQRGIQFIPEINDEVLVAFEYNDINKPYILGSLWNGVDKPPESNSKLINEGKVEKRIIKTRSGHVITFDDTAGKEQISIVDKAGQKFILDSTSGKEKIEVIDKTGRSKITLDASQQNVTIESAKDLTIKATGEIKIDGLTGVKINTNASMELKSVVQTKIESNMTTIQGNATAELKTAAGGKVAVNGPLVMLN
jgi:phage protein D